MPSFLSGKRLILLGFIIVLLVAIPLTVYLVQQQQKTKSSAVQATIVSFVPSVTTANVNDTFSLDVNVDPSGVNQISFVKLLILYDATKLSTSSAGMVVDSWTGNDGNPFSPSVLEGPTYGPGTISLTISVGSSPQNVIQKSTKIATIGFQAIAPTDPGAPTQIQFGNQTQVLSIGSSDQFNENVLSNAPPAQITINSNVTATSAPTPTPTSVSAQSALTCNLTSDVSSVAPGAVANLTTTCQESVGSFDSSTATYTWSATCGTLPVANAPTNTWTAPDSGTCTVTVNVCDASGSCSSPNVSLSVTSTSITSTPTPTVTETPTPTPTPATTAQTPLCSSLVLDRSATGIVPYNINFTINGSSTDSTISSVTFNFGDGQTQTVTSSGGIGSNAVSVLQSHVYNSTGTFTASATVTDANGNVSPVGSCTQTVTINPQTTTVIAANPSPLPPTGPTQLVTVGAIGAALTIIGSVLLFAL